MRRKAPAFRPGISGDSNSGVTLLELLAVMAIISIASVVAVPNVLTYVADYRLKSAANDVYANMHMAKNEAIKRNTMCAIIFDTAHEKYALSIGAGDDGNWSTMNDNTNLKVVFLSSYKSGIQFGVGQFGGSDPVTYNNDRVLFYPSGQCGPLNGYVYLENEKGRAFRIGSLSSGIILIQNDN